MTETSQGLNHTSRERTQCDYWHLLNIALKKSLVVFKSKRTQSVVTRQILYRKKGKRGDGITKTCR